MDAGRMAVVGVGIDEARDDGFPGHVDDPSPGRADPRRDRPDRYEPRVKKRRPKNYKFMRQPRQDYKRAAA